MGKYLLKLPKMGESVAEATLTTWLKDVGDSIAVDESIVEVATDKVDSDVPSEVEGILLEKKFQVNEIAQVGDVIAVIEIAGTDEASEEEEVVSDPLPEVKEKPKYKIYCDMDGVLTDFEKRFEHFSGMHPQEYEKEKGTPAFWELIDNKIGVRFWVGMDWHLPSATTLGQRWWKCNALQNLIGSLLEQIAKPLELFAYLLAKSMYLSWLMLMSASAPLPPGAPSAPRVCSR